MVDFSQLPELNKSLDEIEMPKPRPIGPYLAQVTKKEMIVSSQKQTPGVRIFLTLLAPLDDVDSEAVAAYGDVSGGEFKLDFYLTEKSLFMIKRFLTDHAKIEGNGRTLSQILEDDLVGSQCGVYLDQQISDRDPEVVFNVITSTFAPE